MTRSIYSKLAFTNIRNNRKTYVPYLLTAVLTVMMYYMMDALARNSHIPEVTLRLCLRYADGVILVFAVIFLFYTNSFLIKRRKKEIGIYNVLGMGKRHIAKMLIVEALVTAGVSIAGGVVLGIIFSRLMYLFLMKLLHYPVKMAFEMPIEALFSTLAVFGVIFCLTLAYNLLQIRLANPVELVRGSSEGEREPKSKWFLALLGVVLLGIGYTIALTTESPLSALGLFFVAVICVILGTYALFVAGSVAFLKMLRKNKGYYYKTKHFTAVSGMIYRMKQNAVGLANIAILSTMVLVMISTTVSLYAGMDDLLRHRFPQEISISSLAGGAEAEETIDTVVTEETQAHGVKIAENVQYHYGVFPAVREGSDLRPAEDAAYAATGYYTVSMLPLAEYNAMEHRDVELAEDEALVFYDGAEDYGKDVIQVAGRKYRVKEELKSLKIGEKSASQVVNSYILVLKDEAQILENQQRICQDKDEQTKSMFEGLRFYRGIDLKGKEEDCTAAAKAMAERIGAELPDMGGYVECRELSRESFYLLYGSLFFIGIYLGVLFLMATVLIIYYKQISEGYDDKERYQIMQKVGMSRKEVKRSIRSQILTVFFLPLVTAFIHIAFAFKIITKLLAMLNLVNVPLFLTCTVLTAAVFAVFYGIVYALTAREYYRIVK